MLRIITFEQNTSIKLLKDFSQYFFAFCINCHIVFAWAEHIRDGNTKHENLVFRVYRYKHENPKSKHETNTKNWKIYI